MQDQAEGENSQSAHHSWGASLLVGGDYFYPTASALVRLRIEAKKVTHAIIRADDERKVRMLTWVLFQRAGSADEVRRILEPSASNPNIANAVKMLDLAPYLLPQLAPVEDD